MNVGLPASHMFLSYYNSPFALNNYIFKCHDISQWLASIIKSPKLGAQSALEAGRSRAASAIYIIYARSLLCHFPAGVSRISRTSLTCCFTVLRPFSASSSWKSKSVAWQTWSFRKSFIYASRSWRWVSNFGVSAAAPSGILPAGLRERSLRASDMTKPCTSDYCAQNSCGSVSGHSWIWICKFNCKGLAKQKAFQKPLEMGLELCLLTHDGKYSISIAIYSNVSVTAAPLSCNEFHLF